MRKIRTPLAILLVAFIHLAQSESYSSSDEPSHESCGKNYPTLFPCLKDGKVVMDLEANSLPGLKYGVTILYSDSPLLLSDRIRSAAKDAGWKASKEKTCSEHSACDSPKAYISGATYKLKDEIVRISIKSPPTAAGSSAILTVVWLEKDT